MVTGGGAERRRLAEADESGVPWRRWGPYLSERQWGTVREDYSANGDAWSYFPHDQALSRAYRWGEDGIAGYSDDKQRLCFALALWNGRDPLLKERMFGLTNTEGNHGEDVKEYWFYLDSTPTHSYMKVLYKYPQAEYPYELLLVTNRARGRRDFEYELLDTGVFDDDRYFDVVVEYAKASPEDVLSRSPRTTAAPTRPPCTCCPRCGSATPGRGLAAAPSRAFGRSPAARGGWRSAPTTRSWAGAGCTAPARCRCCSPAMRPTTNGSSAAPTAPRTSRTASTATWSTATPAPSTPSGPAPRRRPTTSSPSPAARAPRCGCASPTPSGRSRSARSST